MASSDPPYEEEPPEDDSPLLDAAEAAEEIPNDDEPDHPMNSDPEEEPPDQEIQLQNDSTAHFDAHTSSIFCIAQHPLQPSIIATGGGDDTTYIFSTKPTNPPLPASFENPAPITGGRASLPPIAKLTGHTDSINALTFTLPNGDYHLSGGLDGQLRAHLTNSPDQSQPFPFLASIQEVPEINFLVPCPHPSYPNTIALGASDGSVWIYTIDPSDKSTPLQMQQAYYLHTESCTAGAWTPDGKMLATVSEDGSLYVWDPFGEAAAADITGSAGGQNVIGLTMDDQRFAVEGGLFSVAVEPKGSFVVVGGAGGMIRVVGLPRLSTSTTELATLGMKGSGAKNKIGGSKKARVAQSASAGQAGQILASIQTQSDSVETLSFASPPLTLLAAGSVDGSIALFDTAHRFAVRRHIREAHEEYAVVKVEFQREGESWLLTSCGMDGVVRVWDSRGGTAASGMGLVREWRGHRGEGEGGGVLGFVQGVKEGRVVTAGDDGVALVFER